MTGPAPVLVVDLGGVTARWLPDRRLDALAQLSGLPPATVDQLVFESGFDEAGDRGRFTAAGFTEELASLLGLVTSPDDDDALRAAWAQAYEPDEGVLRIVRAWPGRTALFTNNGPLTEATLTAELSQVGDAFDELIASWHLGVTKPDPAAFDLAAERIGATPTEIVFVDDAEANVAGARAAGWNAIAFTTALDLHAALASLRTP